MSEAKRLFNGKKNKILKRSREQINIRKGRRGEKINVRSASAKSSTNQLDAIKQVKRSKVLNKPI